MDGNRAQKQLTKGIIKVNLVSLILAVITAILFTVLHGFVIFWIGIHTISYAFYIKEQ